MSGSDNGTERQSNFELMRIVAIVLIIAHHVAVHADWGNGGVFFPENLTANAVILQSLLPFGKIGVNLFVFVSGYFLIRSERSTWPKIVRIWTEMFFYSVVITVIFVIFDGYEFLSAIQ